MCATTTQKIPPWALAQQENHEDKGDCIASSNKQWKEHNHEEKLWPSTFNNLPTFTPNKKPLTLNWSWTPILPKNWCDFDSLGRLRTGPNSSSSLTNKYPREGGS
jgi:hypothetical protein